MFRMHILYLKFITLHLSDTISEENHFIVTDSQTSQKLVKGGQTSAQPQTELSS